MTERIKKTPIKAALAAMDTVWSDAQQRLDDMGPEKALARMSGAVYYNSSHPFRDKLHIEGIQEGLRFALTGQSEVVKSLIKRATAIQTGEIQVSTREVLTPPSKLQVILTGLSHGIGLGNVWKLFRSKPVSLGK